jgi:CheY-like chemotaxis protein
MAALATPLLLLSAAPASAEERVCRGTIGATTVDNMRVPQCANWVLLGTRVKGTIKVEWNATLRAEDVLVIGIDDEAHILADMAEYFTALGYAVECVVDESSACALIDRQDFRIVITDLRLSGGDRYEGLEILERAQTRHPRAACIVLTAYGSPDYEQRARRAGASAFLQKPQPLGELSRIVKALIEGSSIASSVA